MLLPASCRRAQRPAGVPPSELRLSRGFPSAPTDPPFVPEALPLLGFVRPRPGALQRFDLGGVGLSGLGTPPLLRFSRLRRALVKHCPGRRRTRISCHLDPCQRAGTHVLAKRSEPSPLLFERPANALEQARARIPQTIRFYPGWSRASVGLVSTASVGVFPSATSRPVTARCRTTRAVDRDRFLPPTASSLRGLSGASTPE